MAGELAHGAHHPVIDGEVVALRGRVACDVNARVLPAEQELHGHLAADRDGDRHALAAGAVDTVAGGAVGVARAAAEAVPDERRDLDGGPALSVGKGAAAHARQPTMIRGRDVVLGIYGVATVRSRRRQSVAAR